MDEPLHVWCERTRRRHAVEWARLLGQWRAYLGAPGDRPTQAHGRARAEGERGDDPLGTPLAGLAAGADAPRLAGLLADHAQTLEALRS